MIVSGAALAAGELRESARRRGYVHEKTYPTVMVAGLGEFLIAVRSAAEDRQRNDEQAQYQRGASASTRRPKLNAAHARIAQAESINWCEYRECNNKRTPLTGKALHFDFAAVILNDTMTNRQAETCAVVTSRSKKWVEEMR